jgi:hypothetical protein
MAKKKKKSKKARKPQRFGEITPESGTPRDLAYDLTMGWIKLMLDGKTSDLADVHPPSFERKIRMQLTKLYNRLLDQSKMDGAYLEYED